MSVAYQVIDPHPIANEFKYTYFLPSPEELATIEPGDWIKLIVRAIPPSEKWDAERVWVRVTAIHDGQVEGTLDNDPSDIPALSHGDVVRAPLSNAIAVGFEDDQRRPAPESVKREYWDRCVVDQAVLDGDLAVHYIYREEPSHQSDEENPDSGWRIRGDLRDASQGQIESRKHATVALGAVLNRDDSWLHLIDAPIGSAFERDFESGDWIPES